MWTAVLMRPREDTVSLVEVGLTYYDGQDERNLPTRHPQNEPSHPSDKSLS